MQKYQLNFYYFYCFSTDHGRRIWISALGAVVKHCHICDFLFVLIIYRWSRENCMGNVVVLMCCRRRKQWRRKEFHTQLQLAFFFFFTLCWKFILIMHNSCRNNCSKYLHAEKMTVLEALQCSLEGVALDRNTSPLLSWHSLKHQPQTQILLFENLGENWLSRSITGNSHVSC